ncbi:MAG: ankyrin repeat domain-containing protein [Methylophilaceae bacterium]
MNTKLFDAIAQGNLAGLQAELALKPDLTQKDAYGFTPLHRAVMSTNTLNEQIAMALLSALIEAQSPVEQLADDGRTALFLAAEFSPTLAPVALLIKAGANANISDRFGNHIVENAMKEEVQQYLSDLTGHPIPIPPLELDSVKLSAAEWKAAKVHLNVVFEQLKQANIVVLQNAGTTQEDGFADCSEALQTTQAPNGQWQGFCFYSSQDLNRAKRNSQLSLSFWGAPDGNTESMLTIGQAIVDAFKQYPFIVDWSGSKNTRPIIYLQDIGQG